MYKTILLLAITGGAYPFNAFAGEPVRIYQVDKNNITRYDLPSQVVKGDRIYQVDKNQIIRYDQPSQKAIEDRIYQVDKNQIIRYDLPSLKMK